jgi:hypothetical protein
MTASRSQGIAGAQGRETAEVPVRREECVDAMMHRQRCDARVVNLGADDLRGAKQVFEHWPAEIIISEQEQLGRCSQGDKSRERRIGWAVSTDGLSREPLKLLRQRS